MGLGLCFRGEVFHHLVHGFLELLSVLVWITGDGIRAYTAPLQLL